MLTRTNQRCCRLGCCPCMRSHTASCAMIAGVRTPYQFLKSASPKRSQPSHRYSKYESTGGWMDAVPLTHAPVSMLSVVPTRFSDETGAWVNEIGRAHV